MSLDISEDKKPALTGPWYLHYDHWKKTGLAYIDAYAHLPKDALHHLEFRTFAHQSIYRLIYESNLLEGEGLSKGETKKIADEYFPHLPSSYDDIRIMMQAGRDPFDKVFNGDYQAKIDDVCTKYDNVTPSISFKNKSKGFMEVVQHYIAYLEANNKSLRYRVSYMENVRHAYISYLFKKRYNRVPTSDDIDNIISNLHHSDVFNLSYFSSSMKSILNYITELNIPLKPIYLFSEAGIKSLHKSMANGLIHKSAGVAAGEYRIDNRIVGDLDVIFPAPELIPNCMEQFLSRANSLIQPLWVNSENLFEVAAMVSHEFVRIHPFPDFNGRLSRLILTIILNTFGVPFPVTLRGDKKGRHRYLSSLRKANKAHLKPYITLIAMRVSQSFMEIDENLRLEGLPSILTFLPKTETHT